MDEHKEPDCCDYACYEDPGCACEGCKSEEPITFWPTKPNVLIRCTSCGDFEGIENCSVTCLVCMDANQFILNVNVAKYNRMKERLQFLHDRLINVYGENGNIDFLISTRKMISDG